MTDDDPFPATADASTRRTRILSTIELLVLIGIGGFAGSNLRYVSEMVFSGLQATLVVNVLGSFVLGFILYEAIYAGVLAEQTQVVVGTGFLSSFTTYSTFAVQTVQTGSLNWMLLNVFATYGLGFLGVLLGRELARAVDGGDT
ncbi:CrcB family protein [Haloarcula sp. 1CSR25-25]|jgi:CrcB protein|uniref:CrcB family protein n=1 Tax=Haloarcula sp. 1CSR25-25 TaxID=2862545 RepID=UPI002894DF32|nr:CrcB family protein [Haloarcula sp. 1CSR25-25]MDT3436902.1 CrcB family protein [Haloarcula sp. 1CSR25-25]